MKNEDSIHRAWERIKDGWNEARSETWPDAFIHVHNDGSPYVRIPVGRDVEPVDDYDMNTYLLWLDYINLIHDAQRAVGRKITY